MSAAQRPAWGPEQGGGRVRPRHVIAAVALARGVPLAQMTGRTRARAAVRARQAAMWLMHGRLGMTSVAIGRELGGRDHSTVLHGLAQVEAWLDAMDTARLGMDRAWSHAGVLALREAEAAERAAALTGSAS